MTGVIAAFPPDPAARSRRLTVGQAVVEFLAVQESERDGVRRRLIAGCMGIFGHGNLAGVGEGLRRAAPRLRYYQARNEQAMVHAAAAYARMTNRLSTLACTTSIGPGATNMITGAAGATINRLPVLLLPSDSFSSRGPAPVLQQLEHPGGPDVSVNDCFRPVARYFDRITRPEQLVASLPAAMRVLTDPAGTGAVVVALPEDVQTMAYDFPAALFSPRVWRVGRPAPEAELVARAAGMVRASRRPLVVAGGGVVYSEATEALRGLVEATGIPVGETQAGKGALCWDHPQALGAIGATGTPAANRAAREADLVIGVGTRWTDFTTASHTAFADPGVRFVNLNVAPVDGAKHAGLALVGDARAGLAALGEELGGYRVDPGYEDGYRRAARDWHAERDRLVAGGTGGDAGGAGRGAGGGTDATGATGDAGGRLLTQAEVIGAVNEAAGPRDVVVGAAGSLPGDLHKLWRSRDAKGYHVEYGYSCMGYEIAGGLGVKMAAPDREVFVLVGDGSYLMMSGELVTSIQEGMKLVVVLVQNHGYASIGALSESVGSGGFGTWYRRRGPGGDLDGPRLPVDLAANAESLGARVLRPRSRRELASALAEARDGVITTVVHVETDPSPSVPSYGWWDVPVSEVAPGEEGEAVRAARAGYEKARQAVRDYL
ncbi:MAG: 3D-(3,5/4)-trihydroxycyclohexane-1,2-dione acylhydrolase (decyclizing) [Acidimicrobiales bacterium]